MVSRKIFPLLVLFVFIFSFNNVQASDSQANIEVLKSFEGLSFHPISNPFIPPDVQIAVSENYVVEFVNVLGGVWDKNGTFLDYLNLYKLFNASSFEIGDPRIVYDKQSGRFFASVYDADFNAVRIAVSSSSNPFDKWYAYMIGANQLYFPDQPHLGINDDKVIVSTNLFNIYTYEFVGARFWVLNKTLLMQGKLDYYQSDIFPNVASIRPAFHLSPSKALYMATTQIQNHSDIIYIYKVEGTIQNLNISTYQIQVTKFEKPPKAYQKDTRFLLDTIDYRIQDIIWKDNRLIFTANVAYTPIGENITRSALRIIEVNTTNMSVVQDFNYGEKGKYYFDGSLKLSNDNVLYIVFAYSSIDDYPSIMATHQVTKNSLEAPILIKEGIGAETTGCRITYCRYGDYFGSSVDPSDNTVWIAGEFGRGIAGWSTWIAQISLSKYYIIANYEVIGSEGIPPTLVYYYEGKRVSVQLTKEPKVYLVDKNSPWYLTNPLPGSDSTVRWYTNSPTSGIASSPITYISPIYYLQYFVNFEVEGASSSYISVFQFGKKVNYSIPASIWVDAYSRFNATNLLMQTSTERLASNSAEGIINYSGTYIIRYYHQYLVGFKYEAIGKEPPKPAIIARSFGEIFMLELSHEYKFVWLDVNSIFVTYDVAFDKEMWVSYTKGIVDAPKNVTIIYYHKYYVEINIPEGAGIANIKSGWYNEGEVLTINVTANKGYKFYKWEGTYESDNPSITITVNAPIQLNAKFLVLLKLCSDGYGTIRFEDKVVQSYSCLEVYVIQGSEVKLNAEPSWLFKFVSWSTGEKTNEIRIIVNEPREIYAEFELNYVLLMIMIIISIIIMLILAIILYELILLKCKRYA